MKTLMIMAVAACAALASTGAEPEKKSLKQMTPAERQAYFYEKTGGKVSKPGTMSGRLVFLDAQKRLSETNLPPVFAALNQMARYNFVRVAGEAKPATPERFGALRAELKADVLVAIVDEPSLPRFLAAPEDRWAVVNVAKVGDGLKGDAVGKFLESRYRKQLLRAYAHAVGTPWTQFPGNVVSSVDERELDLCGEFLPMDVMDKMARRLKALGVMPERVVSYRRACHEGWAPAPTNDVQKAIWAKMHEMPTKPITIEPEKK